MGCGNSVPKTSSKQGPLVQGPESDDKAALEAEKQAAIAAYAAAGDWLADQKCPVDPAADADCTVMHGELTVNSPALAKWIKASDSWQSTCGWEVKVDCATALPKEGKKGRLSRKIFTADQLKNFVSRSIDLGCSDYFFDPGTEDGKGYGDTEEHAEDDARKTARANALVEARRLGGLFKCGRPSCSSTVSDLWIAQAELTKPATPLDEKHFEAMAKCAFAVNVYCEDK